MLSLLFRSLYRTGGALYCLTIGIALLVSCSKEDALSERSDFFTVTDSIAKEEPIRVFETHLEGGKDTLYVYSNLGLEDFEVFFQTDDQEDDWITMDRSEYLEKEKAIRLILNVSPLKETYARRTGTLSFSNKEKFLGQFVQITQGYLARFSTDFSWLKYGVVNPLDGSRETLISNWSAAQNGYGWTSTIAEGTAKAYCFGRNGHVKLGTETAGADLITPMFGELGSDSIMLLTFNAVAFVNSSGVKDHNRLTVMLLNGGEFESGGTTATVDLNYYDYASSLLDTRFWDNSLHALYIKKPELNPKSSTMQIRFVTGDGLSATNNRVFIDNVNLFTVYRKENQ